MGDSVFRDPEAVERELRLPAVVPYSFVGDASPGYHARLMSLVEGLVGVENVRYQTVRARAGGKWAAYRFEVWHERFSEVEALYAGVMALPGTRFVL